MRSFNYSGIPSLIICSFLLLPLCVYAQSSPEASRQAFEAGNEAFWSGRYPDAVRSYTEAISLDTGVAQYYFHRGKAFFQMNRYPKAIADFSKVIEKAPHSAKAYNMRGRARYILKDYDGAVADYDVGAALQRKRGAKSLKGWEHAMNGEVGEALFHWVTQLQQGYDNQYDINAMRHWADKAYNSDTLCIDFQILAQETIGMTYFAQEQYDRALKYLSEADRMVGELPLGSLYTAKYFPELNFNLYYVYAGILLNKGRFNQAIGLFEQIAKIEPKNHLPFFALSQAHFYRGDRQQALNYLESALNKGLSWSQLTLVPDYYESLKLAPEFISLRQQFRP